MKKLVLAASCVIATVVFLAAFGPQTKPVLSSEYPTPSVREEQRIVIGGVTETWQLKWTAPPKPVCEPSDVSLTCPCTGFAYGEGGDLVLIRLRNQIEIDHLQITPFFEAQFPDIGQVAIVQRWQPDLDKDVEASLSLGQDFSKLVAKRPVVQVMHFADYDHDGRQSEFYVQTGTAPCGKRVGIVIGVSRGNPRLHVFGTASKPTKPLYLQKEEWDALRRASGSIEALEWSCGDHGAEREFRLRHRWTLRGIDGTRREFTCPPNPRRLIREDPL